VSSTAVPSERAATRRAPRIRALLIEDVEPDAALVLRALTAHGYEVTSTRVDDRPGLEAALASGPYDLCIADYALPRIDAMTVLEVLRKAAPDLPVIVVSGSVSEVRAVEAMRAGAQDCISKQQLARLGPAVDRGLAEADRHRNHRVTEAARRESAAEARSSERRFQSLVAAMEDVVFSVDADLRYTGVYGRGAALAFRSERVIGKRPQEVLERSLASLHETAYARVLAGEPVVFDWSSEEPEGTRHFQTSVSPLRNDPGEVCGIVGVTRDVTRQKEMQEQLLLSERLATVGSMTASLTHELNNPLTSLLLNLECLVSESTPLEEPLADAWAAARRLLDIITDVKLLARAADDRHGKVDICTVLDSTARLAAPQLRDRARVVKEYPETPAEVQGNESRLGQVFLNLIINAAQAIAPGNADESTIRLVVCSDAISTTVEVIDTGVGMPREVLARLFTPFFTTKPAGIGTGIGLSISKRIIDSVGGRIEVESEVGRGTTFRVIFPAITPDDETSQ
jgi:PAS domain S-box-containing protein